MFLLNKAYCLNLMGRYEEALKCINKTLELNPKEISFLKLKCEILSDFNREEEAIKCYEEVLKILDENLETKPEDKFLLKDKANCLCDMGRYEDAVSCFEKVLKVDPNFAIAWFDKGNCLCDMGRYEDAIICFDEALMINPNLPFVEPYKAVCLNRLKLEGYDEILKINPKDESTLKKKINCLLELE